MAIEITKSTVLKEKPDAEHLTFGRVFTDHMLISEYDENGWGEWRIIPYSLFFLWILPVWHYTMANQF